MFADTAQGWVGSAVVNAAWSRVWNGRNMSGVQLTSTLFAQLAWYF